MEQKTYGSRPDEYDNDLSKAVELFQAKDVLGENYLSSYDKALYSGNLPSQTGNVTGYGSVGGSTGSYLPSNTSNQNQIAKPNYTSVNSVFSNNNAVGSPELERLRGVKADIAEEELKSMGDFDWSGAANLGMGIGNFGMGISSFLDNRKYNKESLGALQDNRQYARESNDRLNNFTNKTISAFATS